MLDTHLHTAARLHERIMSMPNAAKAELDAMANPSKPGPKGKKRVKEMHIRHGASGGYIVRHDFHEGEPEEHVKATNKDLLDHVSESMGGEGEGEGGEGEAEEEPAVIAPAYDNGDLALVESGYFDDKGGIRGVLARPLP